MEKQNNCNVLVLWRGMELRVDTNSDSNMKAFGQKLQELTHVKPDTMKLFVPQTTNRSKMLSPFPDTCWMLSFQESAILQEKPIRMMSVLKDEIDEVSHNSKSDLRIVGFDEEEKRLKQRTSYRPQTSLKLPQGNYIFCEFHTLKFPGIQNYFQVHMVYSEHDDADFFALKKQLNEEADRLGENIGLKLGGVMNSSASTGASSIAAAYSRLLNVSAKEHLLDDNKSVGSIGIFGSEPDPDDMAMHDEPDPDDFLNNENMLESDPDTAAAIAVSATKKKIEQTVNEPDPDDAESSGIASYEFHGLGSQELQRIEEPAAVFRSLLQKAINISSSMMLILIYINFKLFSLSVGIMRPSLLVGMRQNTQHRSNLED